jgi:hypothetical protein
LIKRKKNPYSSSYLYIYCIWICDQLSMLSVVVKNCVLVLGRFR